jgi:hypothetical protein
MEDIAWLLAADSIDARVGNVCRTLIRINVDGRLGSGQEIEKIIVGADVVVEIHRQVVMTFAGDIDRRRSVERGDGLTTRVVCVAVRAFLVRSIVGHEYEYLGLALFFEHSHDTLEIHGPRNRRTVTRTDITGTRWLLTLR